MNDIDVGIARFTVEYGLDADGNGYITEQWDNLAAPDEDVPMVTRAGLLAMSQQTLTAEALGHFDDEGGVSMATGYARGGIIQGGQSAGVGYDPDSDGPLIDPAAHDRWARREVDRLNRNAPTDEE